MDRIQTRDRKDPESSDCLAETPMVVRRSVEVFCQPDGARSCEDPARSTLAVQGQVTTPPGVCLQLHLLLLTDKKGLTAGESQR